MNHVYFLVTEKTPISLQNNKFSIYMLSRRALSLRNEEYAKVLECWCQRSVAMWSKSPSKHA